MCEIKTQNKKGDIKNKKAQANVKSQYTKQLSSISSEVSNIPGGLSTAQMETAGSLINNAWNTEMNNIMTSLKGGLSASKYKELEISQQKWEAKKSEDIKNIEKQGGSIVGPSVLSESAKLNKERCYYLVENYINDSCEFIEFDYNMKLNIARTHGQGNKLTKKEYLTQLSTIENQARNVQRGTTTAQMVTTGGVVYNLWNDEMDKIMSTLKSELSASQYQKLETSQQSWLNKKDNIIKEVANKGGSVSAVNAINKNINVTKARCYYLVNNFMK